MWMELRSAVFDKKKVPIYAPYLVKLIEDTWYATFPSELLVTDHMVHHGVLKLRVKENWGIPRDIPEITPSDSDDEPEPDYELVPRSKTGPSWASKLRKNMKDLFYFHAKGQYKAHVDAKKAHSREKMIMRKIGLEVQSGSEDTIMDEEYWIKEHCKWSGSEEEASAEEELSIASDE
ncbi:hypothetical protein D1007_47737 [Hordeum vulgare]|nr:hypothetical protein D1007_47737 [Hordeum vulgare]